MFLIKFCNVCQKNYSGEWSSGDITGFFVGFMPNDNICPYCHNELKETKISYEEYKILINISKDPSFIEAMIKLCETDIIEYQLKMSQFRTQLQQQEQSRVDNIPHCPHCSSHNIAKIGTMERAGSIAVMGIFSKKINKSFKCKSCGYTW